MGLPRDIGVIYGNGIKGGSTAQQLLSPNLTYMGGCQNYGPLFGSLFEYGT